MKLCEHCLKNPAEEEHNCPYREDISNDYEFKCDCCSDCQQQCREDI